MRLLISFILALISYILILFLLYFLFPKPKKQKEVLVHTAIVVKKTTIKQNIIKKKLINSSVKNLSKPKETKKIVTKTKAKSAVTKSGNVKFNDIFKNVKANVPTTPLHLKKQLVMSRFKGDNILKNLSKIKTINVNISYSTKKSSNNIKQNEINELINQIGKIWYQISNIPGEYAVIKIIVNNSKINAIILDSNLNQNAQQLLINQIEQIKFNKNMELTIKFQTKVNK